MLAVKYDDILTIRLRLIECKVDAARCHTGSTGFGEARGLLARFLRKYQGLPCHYIIRGSAQMRCRQTRDAPPAVATPMNDDDDADGFAQAQSAISLPLVDATYAPAGLYRHGAYAADADDC